MAVKTLTDAFQLDNLIQSSKDTIVIDLYRQRCGPCKKIEPKFDRLSEKYTKAKFVKIDLDENEDVKDLFLVEAVPTFTVMQNKKLKIKSRSKLTEVELFLEDLFD